jgi:hypothetical protein
VKLSTLEDARETLPHSVIQVAGAKLVGLPELPILEDSSHSGKRHVSVGCLLLIDARHIIGGAYPIEPTGDPPHEGGGSRGRPP